MRTVRLLIICVSVVITRCQYQWGWGRGDPEMNNTEQVSSDDHQMSAAGVSGYPRFHVGGVPYNVTYPMMHVMLPIPLPCKQTDAFENMTFPQLLLRAVITRVEEQ